MTTEPTKRPRGRPPKYAERTARVSVRLPVPLLQRFRKLAEKRNLDLSDIIYEALSQPSSS